MGIYRTVYEEPGTGRMWGLYLVVPPTLQETQEPRTPSSRGKRATGKNAASAPPVEQRTPALPAGWYLLEEGVGEEVRPLDGFTLPPDTPIEIAGSQAESYARRRGFRSTRIPTPFQWPPEEWQPK